MKVPKYVIELMERAKYNYTASGEHYAVGYTIDIAKFSHYEYADTFEKEINRFVNWCNREWRKTKGWDGKIAYVLYLPQTTEYKAMQYATVTIYDPVMKHLEQYINKN